MSATADEYEWFDELFPDLAEAYCITLVEKVGPVELVHRLGGGVGPVLTGGRAITDAAFDLPEVSADMLQLTALVALGAWTLMIEPNGYIGVTEDKAVPASTGTRWVSHFVNIDGVDAFLWVEDGEVRLSFEPSVPEVRWGSNPDDSLDAMRAAGFDFSPEPPDTYAPASASFAFAEHLTGVRLSPDVIRDSSFQCGLVPVR
ncbi:hypothetical protein GT354_05400 [Streptomyces sp. SID3343]|nr:DUF6461 domain-containing protein [Streptomyces sp. SID3343]MYV97722.1 hypothetical protein [Streptomyces sp. SID3343]